MKKKHLLPVLFAIALLYAGCATHHSSMLRVSSNVWPGYEMLYLARNLGYYDGMPIRLIGVPSTVQVTKNLRNGTIEGGCLTLDETLGLLQDSIDLRIILVMDESRGADVLMARPGINTLQDLRGKRVGVENVSVGAVMLDAALEAAGLQTEDIILVPVTVDEHFNAYCKGKVDAVVTFEPVRSQLLSEGAHILFSSAEVPGRIVDVLVVRGEAIESHSAEIEKLIEGYFQALEYFKRHPGDAAIRMKPRLGNDPLAQFKGIHIPDLAENRVLLAGDSARINQTVNSLQNLMLKKKLLSRPIPIGHFAEPMFLPNTNP